ncbi:hypothetical protein FQN54_006202 [Arachnomyces sp. PD_36]|nr:hypothetical protein FQN54_006202 [Arachnomyces sp. PD_36]
MEGEPDKTPFIGPSADDTVLKVLPIRTRAKEADAEPVGETEADTGDGNAGKPVEVDAQDLEKKERNVDEDGVEVVDGPDLWVGDAQPKDENTEVKKKKKKKSKGARGKKKPTGFEEYYADPPLTVAEFEENKSLYDSSRPAVERLETAIQRYQAKRRMDEERRSVFTKYMAFGGVTVGPKMFGGVDQKDMEAMDAAEILTARAQATITSDRSEWIVDFEQVAKGFLSSVLPTYFALDTEELARSSVNIVKNFLNYILHHNVCPEYKDNIDAARAVCDVAYKELWNTRCAAKLGAGKFNTGCAQLFGGVPYDLAQDVDESDQAAHIISGMTDNDARKVIKFALVGGGTYEQAVRFRYLANTGGLKAYPLEKRGFEVTAIIPPDAELRDFYHDQAPDLEPLGKIRAKPWHDSALAKEDLPPSDGNGSDVEDIPVEYEFFLEESLQKLYFVGMKVDATIWELNCGVHYFDQILSVQCSFYTTLPNDQMLGWKKPRDLRAGDLEAGQGDTDNEDGDDGDN